MAKRKKDVDADKKGDPAVVAVTANGIRTGGDFINVMAAIMNDLANGRITSHVANAMCNAGGKMLKCAEMQAKQGRKVDGQVGRVLELAPLSESPTVQ
jgi:hypothetical protein